MGASVMYFCYGGSITCVSSYLSSVVVTMCSFHGIWMRIHLLGIAAGFEGERVSWVLTMFDGGSITFSFLMI